MSDNTKPYDAGDETHVKSAKRKGKLAEAQKKADLKVVMSTPEGRRHIWGQLEICGVYDDTLHTDPLMLGRFLGRRSLGLKLLQETILYCRKEYLLMESEARNQQKEDKANG